MALLAVSSGERVIIGDWGRMDACELAGPSPMA
jgi:hypothetical protein